MTIIAVGAGWILLGVTGMLFWWTRDDDFEWTTGELGCGDTPFLVMGAVLGPFTWLIGWHISRGIRRENG